MISDFLYENLNILYENLNYDFIIFLTIYKISYYKVRVSTGIEEQTIPLFHLYYQRRTHTEHSTWCCEVRVLRAPSHVNICHSFVLVVASDVFL